MGLNTSKISPSNRILVYTLFTNDPCTDLGENSQICQLYKEGKYKEIIEIIRKVIENPDFNKKKVQQLTNRMSSPEEAVQGWKNMGKKGIAWNNKNKNLLESISKPVAKPVTKPAAKFVAKPTAKPAAKPAEKSVAKPVPKRSTKKSAAINEPKATGVIGMEKSKINPKRK